MCLMDWLVMVVVLLVGHIIIVVSICVCMFSSNGKNNTENGRWPASTDTKCEPWSDGMKQMKKNKCQFVRMGTGMGQKQQRQVHKENRQSQMCVLVPAYTIHPHVIRVTYQSTNTHTHTPHATSDERQATAVINGHNFLVCFSFATRIPSCFVLTSFSDFPFFVCGFYYYYRFVSSWMTNWLT